MRTNTYAEPASALGGRSSRRAPTTAVSPETATDHPNTSLEAASEAVSLACWVQVTPERRKTYAEPAPLLSRYAPTTAVSPETATETPNSSDWAASEAMSLAC